jgi:hypothetical protein
MLSTPRTPLPMMRMLGRKEHWRHTRILPLPTRDFASYQGFPPRSSFRPTNNSMMAEHTAHLRRAAVFPRINVTSTPTPFSNPISDLSPMYATFHRCPSSIISLGVCKTCSVVYNERNRQVYRPLFSYPSTGR